MMRAWMAGAALLTLSACSSAPPEPEPPPAPVASRPRPAPVAVAPAPPRDQCGAAQHQQFVGRPRTEIPVPVNPNLQRVACTTCPVTQDFSPSRLNFFFDADTGLIREVRCG
jgi:hypothetical protein